MGEFCRLVEDEVKSILGKDVEIACGNMQKNNAVNHDAMLITEADSNVTQGIVMDEFYSDYLRGLVSVENVARTVASAYENSRELKFDKLEDICSFDHARDKIVFKLINGGLNEKYLESVPHIRIFDLAITFVCLLSLDGATLSSMRITNDHAKGWNVTVKELFEAAEENTPRLLPYTLRTMSDVIREILCKRLGGSEADSGLLEALTAVEKDGEGEPFGCMYVLSNSFGVNGAASILCRGADENVRERIGRDYMILPSSIHELILIPEPEEADLPNMRNMVREVNDAEVPDEDILSYDVYRAVDFMSEYERIRQDLTGKCA
ncbi:MAG: hypothetical protein ILP10_08885 [Lachnospiraceae bacterium]|nr:hypothetical protein [Lachnospiraceae bacterium]